MAPYDRNSGSNKTGQAALPHKNIQIVISDFLLKANNSVFFVKAYI